MTNWFIGQGPRDHGAKVSSLGPVVIGANVSGRPILGGAIVSSTSIGGIGWNLLLEVQDGAGRIFYIPARSSTF